jgi:diacylglycerol O-acyltransferase
MSVTGDLRRAHLSAIEDGYLALEHEGEPMHIGSLGLFEAAPLLDAAGALKLGEIRDHIEGRLDGVPRLRQRTLDVPFGLGRRVWVDDADFRIADHIDAVALEPPGDEAALLRMAARILGEPLPRGRAPWHLRFITGVSGGRIALVQRVHHASADGIAGVDVDLAILDLQAAVEPRPPSTWQPAPRPGSLTLVSGAVLNEARGVAGVAAAAVGALVRSRDRRAVLRRARETVATVVRDGLAPRSSLNQPVGAQRELTVLRTDLDEVRLAAHARDVKVNDIVLAAVTGGLRALLLERGEALPSHLELKVLVPVSLRDREVPSAFGNQVSGVVVGLPVGIGDPDERVDLIAAATRAAKERREARALGGLLDAADLMPPPATREIARLVDHQPFVNLVVTNVPGPPFPLYLMGARLLEAIPVVPLGGNLTIGVAILSYDGGLVFGVTSDPGTCPDVTTFVDGAQASLAALVHPTNR